MKHRILLQGDGFIYLLPRPELQKWISNYTVCFPKQDILSDAYTVLPHGSATLVITFDGTRLSSSLFGPSTVSSHVGERANKNCMIFIIEFQPAGLYAFTGSNQQELTDKIFFFDRINKSLCKEIEELLERKGNLNDILEELELLLFNKLHNGSPPVLKAAIETIIRNGGKKSAAELADEVFYSKRHINRIFNEYLGMNTKTFSRLVRVNRAIHMMRRRDNNMVEVYSEMGFYDMPHFNHDFKMTCGITPQQFRNNMSDFYNEIAKY